MNDMINKNEIKTGHCKHFTIQVVTMGAGRGQQWARTLTSWNAASIEWCDWRPIKVAKSNLIDFLTDEGIANAKGYVDAKLSGVKWGQMSGGKRLAL